MTRYYISYGNGTCDGAMFSSIEEAETFAKRFVAQPYTIKSYEK